MREALLRRILHGHKRTDIIHWLQDEGVPFAEAYAAYRQAEIDLPYEEERIKSEEVEATRRAEAETARIASAAEDTFRLNLEKRNPAFPFDENVHPERSCETCGDPTFWCGCSYKGASFIPF